MVVIVLTEKIFVQNIGFKLYFLDIFYAPMSWCGQINFENLKGFAASFRDVLWLFWNKLNFFYLVDLN